MAQRCQSDVIVDAFCGCGGNAIQFAKTCRQVIAIDIDPMKIACARRNAKIYGVEDRIEWIQGDVIHILPFLKADCIFLSPPWGGPEYLDNGVSHGDYLRGHSSHSYIQTFDVDRIQIGGLSGTALLQLARLVTPNVAFYIPRTVLSDQMSNIESESEYENIYFNDKRKAVTVYYGNLRSV